VLDAAVIISPIILTLFGFLLATVSALLAGGVAWGKFSSALETLRADHAALRNDLKEAVHTLGGVAVLRERVDSLTDDVRTLRQGRHDQAAQIARLTEQIEALRQRSSTH
jgi:outer membrane murein-binding lipoprotein Lpp